MNTESTQYRTVNYSFNVPFFFLTGIFIAPSAKIIREKKKAVNLEAINCRSQMRKFVSQIDSSSFEMKEKCS